MKTAEISLESILAMLSTLSPENKAWLGHHLLDDAEESEMEDEPTDFACPYSLEEAKERLSQSLKDVEAGHVYTTEEVLAMCREDIGFFEKVAI